MSEYATRELAELAAEQKKIQRHHGRTRALTGYDGYNSHFFPPKLGNGTPVTRFLQERHIAATSIQSLIGSMREQNRDRPLRWTDMCGGFGVAMRQLKFLGAAEHVVRTCVDIAQHDPATVQPRIVEEYKAGGFDIFDPQHAPDNFLYDDVVTVNLPGPQDLITSVQGLMYLRDPLKFVANCYNQLAPGGLALLATRTYWGLLMHQGGQGAEAVRHVAEELEEHDVPYAFANDKGDDGAHCFNTLALQRVEGTRLQASSVIRAQTDWSQYMNVQYAAGAPALRVVYE